MSRTIRKRKISKQWDRHHYVEDWVQDNDPLGDWGKRHLMQRYNVRTVKQAVDRARAEYHRRGYRRRWVNSEVKKIVQHEFRQATRTFLDRVMQGKDDLLEPVPVPFGKWYWD